MPWNEPIYDRTANDVAQRLPKGFFNVADWVRINGNTRQVQAIVNIMLSLNLPFTELAQPSITTIPSVEDINAFVANIERLRAAAYLPVSTGVTPLKTDYKAGNSADAPDYNAVNAWERDLALIRELLVNAANDLIYCGVSNCGQVRPWASRFRNWQGYVPEAIDYRRVPRLGLAAGTGLTRQNRWRSPVDNTRRAPRAGVMVLGTGITRQNGFRRYA